jgi:HK97 family phage major capsid protein
MLKAKELREKRANLATQAQAIIDLADTEKRELTAEETVSFDKFHKEIEDLRGQVERIERHEAVEQEMNESRGTRAAKEDRRGGGYETADSDVAKVRAARIEAENRAFDSYLRNGFSDMTPEHRQIMMERRAQTVGTNSSGGYTVAPAFYDQLETALKAFGGMRQGSTVITTDTGATMPMPTENDTANVGAILGENTQVSEQDIAFGVVNIGAFMYSSKSILVPLQLLQDSAFDLNAYIVERLTERLGRIQNTHFTVGTGSGQPHGIVPQATLGVTGATGETLSLIYDDLVGLQHSVDPAYRQGGQWMFHDTTLLAIKKLKDSQGHPLWQPNVQAGQPDLLLGNSYIVNQDMPVMAADAKSILFGRLSKYFIRDVKEISIIRLVERYADFGQVGFLGWARADGNLLDAGTHPVTYFANSAT